MSNEGNINHQAMKCETSKLTFSLSHFSSSSFTSCNSFFSFSNTLTLLLSWVLLSFTSLVLARWVRRPSIWKVGKCVKVCNYWNIGYFCKFEASDNNNFGNCSNFTFPRGCQECLWLLTAFSRARLFCTIAAFTSSCCVNTSSLRSNNCRMWFKLS